LVLFFKKELLVFTYFFNFWTAWELPKNFHIHGGALTAAGVVEAQGDMSQMRFSEVRRVV
jgi:hypothetical protein